MQQDPSVLRRIQSPSRSTMADLKKLSRGFLTRGCWRNCGGRSTLAPGGRPVSAARRTRARADDQAVPSLRWPPVWRPRLSRTRSTRSSRPVWAFLLIVSPGAHAHSSVHAVINCRVSGWSPRRNECRDMAERVRLQGRGGRRIRAPKQSGSLLHSLSCACQAPACPVSGHGEQPGKSRG
jgi:hypothetical protein